jgi:tetratricopeptide (TPR) repeat protein
MMLISKLFTSLAFTLAICQIMTDNSPLLQVYAHFKLGASGRPQFDGTIVFGEVKEIPVDIYLANEEGDKDIRLGKGFLEKFEIHLEKDGEPIPTDELEFHWSDQLTKYVYLGEPTYDSQDFSKLEASIGVKTRLTLKWRNGSPFSYGDYKLRVSFNTTGIQFVDGRGWKGRLFPARDSLRVTDANTFDDVKSQYAQLAADALVNNKPEEARELYERLVMLEPKNPHYHAGLASVWFRLGKYEKAVEHYEKALPIVLGPNAPLTTIPYRLALSYVAIGREDKAVETIKRALSFLPERLQYIVELKDVKSKTEEDRK